MECDDPSCDFKTEKGIPSYELQVKRLEVHVATMHKNPPATQRAKPPQIPRPELAEDASEQEWAMFEVKWGRFKRTCLHGSDKTTIVDHLWACCSNALEDAILKHVGKNLDTEEEMLE